ncbi:meiotic recombination protein REC114-like isoform X1 [Biomphalaria glabrata]|uniref:Meiotic recombination protein REC114-like isoform X1 n=1 Tax=Biomphalaria glabrata TaxID=6526 RepID=A0A9U8DVJ7_BIOGL|nr:meiotic recombination protein REC114-like isoform X1 [Biomphalaria glabrata]KAI8736814.1 meiotic recombination protein REC114-like isoform X1 [Biomphalaria glabrata]KAI8776828.1 meiotic recombination protein REC114 isoform X1 [Biomphalaria glabrata]
MSRVQIRTWCLDKYARFIQRSPPDGGVWKPYGNEKEQMLMSLSQENQLTITQGSTLLESHNLVRANSFMRGLSRTDSLLFLYKLQNETRRFKVKFSALETKTGQEVCAEAILVLSNFITIKTNINIKDQSSEGNNLIGCQMPGTHEQSIAALNNSLLHGEVTVGTMAKALLDRTNLPSAYYQCQSDSELIPQLLQTCLADPTFPAYVEAVEAQLKELISNDS